MYMLSDKILPFGNTSLAEKIRQQIKDGEYAEATDTWSELETVIDAYSNSVV